MYEHASPLPPSIKAQRVLLWVMAVITWLNAWVTLLDGMENYDGGPFFAFGLALPYVGIGVLCAVLAVKLRHPRRWVRVVIIIVHVFFLLSQLVRIVTGDPTGVIGMVFPIVGLVLVSAGGTRDYFATDQVGR